MELDQNYRTRDFVVTKAGSQGDCYNTWVTQYDVDGKGVVN